MSQIPLIGLILATGTLILFLRSDLPFLRQGTRRVDAVVVRHDIKGPAGAMLYAAIFGFADQRGAYREVRDSLYTPFPKPVIGEPLTIVHPIGSPEKARIPHPWFRGMVYAGLGYAIVRLVWEVAGFG